MRTFFENNLKKLSICYEVILALFVSCTLLSLILIIKRVRNAHRLPQDAGLMGVILQTLTILALLGPKMMFISTSLIFAPYTFPIGYVAEYVLIIMYNWMINGDTKGRFD